MNILIVGAGAVGCAYGVYAQRGGAQVSFLVKPTHTDRLQSPYRVYEYVGLSKAPRTLELHPTEIFTSQAEALKKEWDFVLLTVPSDAIRKGTWLKELVNGIKDATLLSLQPGHDDQKQIIAAGLNPNRLIVGTIPILSYLAPLPGDLITRPGIAFWLPPATHALWFGESPLVSKVTELFTRGGLRSKEKQNRGEQLVFGETLLRLIVLGLERSQWSFQELTRPQKISTVSQAIQETIPLALSLRALPPRTATLKERILTSPLALKIILHVVSALTPFSFEAFMKAHFTKVAPQMHEGLERILSVAKSKGLPHEALKTLSQK